MSKYKLHIANNKYIIPITAILFVSIFFACTSVSDKTNSVELIKGTGKQDSIFNNLLTLTNNILPEEAQNDSLAFLILPVQASCPSCRKKTIDSIVKYKEKLAARHFIVISAEGGRKTINSYFIEEDRQLPVIENKLFLDSLNKAFKFELYSDKPTIYYTARQKAYKKVAAIPATVKQDLQEFFSGNRSNDSK
jgi:hypothetical protein